MTGDNVRRFIVDLDYLDEDHHIFGPYTERAAEKAEKRIRRWLAKTDLTEGGDWILSRYPIHQWGAWDEV